MLGFGKKRTITWIDFYLFLDCEYLVFWEKISPSLGRLVPINVNGNSNHERKDFTCHQLTIFPWHFGTNELFADLTWQQGGKGQQKKNEFTGDSSKYSTTKYR